MKVKKPAENKFFCKNGDYNQFMIDILPQERVKVLHQIHL